MTNSLTKTLLTAAAIGLAVTVPFVIMELVNRWGYDQSFPLFLFALLWINTSVFCAAVLLIVRSLRNARGTAPSRWAVLRLVVVVLILTVVAVVAADAWTTVVSDQWPCFMGVPNCD